jgi:hypothetical protein
MTPTNVGCCVKNGHALRLPPCERPCEKARMRCGSILTVAIAVLSSRPRRSSFRAGSRPRSPNRLLQHSLPAADNTIGIQPTSRKVRFRAACGASQSICPTSTTSCSRAIDDEPELRRPVEGVFAAAQHRGECPLLARNGCKPSQRRCQLAEAKQTSCFVGAKSGNDPQQTYRLPLHYRNAFDPLSNNSF